MKIYKKIMTKNCDNTFYADLPDVTGIVKVKNFRHLSRSRYQEAVILCELFC